MINNKILKITGSKDNINDIRYAGTHGMFCIYNNQKHRITYFNHCRELFGRRFNKNIAYIGFAATGMDIKSINDFFGIVQDKVGDSAEIIIHPTNQKNFIVVELTTPFWNENAFKRGMFTLLLRCATYYRDDFDEAVQKYSLTALIKPVISRFLNGHTKIKGRMRYGVVDFFRPYNYNSWNYKRRALRKDYKDILVKTL